jgi:hypothetical protein
MKTKSKKTRTTRTKARPSERSFKSKIERALNLELAGVNLGAMCVGCALSAIDSAARRVADRLGIEFLGASLNRAGAKK